MCRYYTSMFYKNFTGYIHRNETNQRNEFLADVIQPNQDYYEVLPCVNVCQAIVRDCPANFGFYVPRKMIQLN